MADFVKTFWLILIEIFWVEMAWPHAGGSKWRAPHGVAPCRWVEMAWPHAGADGLQKTHQTLFN